MFAELKKFWRDLMTEDDGGTTYCPVRVFGASLITLFHAGVFSQIMHGNFDPEHYAIGAGGLIAAIGTSIGIKHATGADHA